MSSLPRGTSRIPARGSSIPSGMSRSMTAASSSSSTSSRGRVPPSSAGAGRGVSTATRGGNTANSAVAEEPARNKSPSSAGKRNYSAYSVQAPRAPKPAPGATRGSGAARGGVSASRGTSRGGARKASAPEKSSTEPAEEKTAVVKPKKPASGRPKPSAAFMAANKGAAAKTAAVGADNGASAIFSPATNEPLHAKILQSARASGALNLSGRGLVEIPEKLYTINEPDEDASPKKGFNIDKVSSTRLSTVTNVFYKLLHFVDI